MKKYLLLSLLFLFIVNIFGCTEKEPVLILESEIETYISQDGGVIIKVINKDDLYLISHHDGRIFKFEQEPSNRTIEINAILLFSFYVGFSFFIIWIIIIMIKMMFNVNPKYNNDPLTPK